ncbi:hypothetical protein M23134_08392 [Microscilla marina ATCC 23134]|uniref:Uncharacterized protein n=1 Tax=Microscilla marina ATCC 23134 TaxID=313606 RepID=A1ZR29_MICM2|nr:hypothetical protein M23134_08392 [Microscilla marina ATCC 23134]
MRLTCCYILGLITCVIKICQKYSIGIQRTTLADGQNMDKGK